MKTRLLVGLLTVALGGLTSCSNILEENGVINNVAESGMGELRINLTTDPTVEAITKSGEGLTEFKVGIDNKIYRYSEWNNQTLTVATGQKKITAYNIAENDVSNFAWNAPYYMGSKDVNITAAGPNVVTIDCSRANSTLVVDTTGFMPEKGQTKILCVKSLVAYEGDADTNGFDLLKKEEQTPSNNDSVYVKAGITAKIVLTPAKMDGTELLPVTTYINSSNSNSSSEHTEAAKRYKVSYTVNDQNGQATIKITVNDSVKEVEIPAVEINPYDSTTQENQSTNGGGE